MIDDAPPPAADGDTPVSRERVMAELEGVPVTAVADLAAARKSRSRRARASADAPRDAGPNGGNPPPGKGADRPTIACAEGHLPQFLDASRNVVAAHTRGNPLAGVYVRSGPMLMRLLERGDDDGLCAYAPRRPADADEKHAEEIQVGGRGQLLTARVSVEWLRLHLARLAEFQRFDRRANAWVACHPPAILAPSFLADSPWRGLPRLTGVVQTPSLRADGSILAAEGWDGRTGLLVAFSGETYPHVPETPSRGQARAALAELRDALSEFPFADAGAGDDPQPSEAAALAMLLTSLVRRSLPSAPAFAVTATKASTGKTALAGVASWLAHGGDPLIVPPAKEESEFQKRLLALLIDAPPLIVLDNVRGDFQSTSFETMLTATSYSDRLLSKTEQLTVDTNVTWCITGNNLKFSGDMPSRVLLIELDARVEKPEERVFTRSLPAFLAAHRPRLVVAALTVMRAYIAAGRPAVAGMAGSRFPEWSRLVRAPLVWLGCADPLATQARVIDDDPARAELVAVLAAWREQLGDVRMTVRDLAAGATGDLAEALTAVAGEKGGINARRLGRWLLRNEKRIEAGLMVCKVPGVRGHCGKPYWRVVAAAGE